MLDKKRFSKYLDLQEGIEETKVKLARFQVEVAAMQAEVDIAIQDVAERLLVDDNGNPVDSGVYWYSGLAIVRVGLTVTVIPMKTMDYAKMFNSEEEGD